MMYPSLETHHGVGLVFVDGTSGKVLMPPTIPEDIQSDKNEAVFSINEEIPFDDSVVLDTAQALIAGSVGKSKWGMIGGKVDRHADGQLEALPKALAREWCEEISELLGMGQFQSLSAEGQANILSFITRVCEKIEQTDPQVFTPLSDLRVVQWREVLQEDGTLTRDFRGMLTVTILSLVLDENSQEQAFLKQLGFAEIEADSLDSLRPYAQVVIRQLGLL